MKALAERIARDLFTNGQGEHAERLVLIDANGRDLGGWCEQAVVDRIEGALRGPEAPFDALDRRHGETQFDYIDRLRVMVVELRASQERTTDGHR